MSGSERSNNSGSINTAETTGNSKKAAKGKAPDPAVAALYYSAELAARHNLPDPAEDEKNIEPYTADEVFLR